MNGRYIGLKTIIVKIVAMAASMSVADIAISVPGIKPASKKIVTAWAKSDPTAKRKTVPTRHA